MAASQKSKSSSAPIGETLEDIRLLLNKSGRYTPERQREIDAVRENQARREAELKASRLLLDCGIFKKYETADLDDLEYVTARLPADQLMRYVRVRDKLKELLDFPSIFILQGENGPGKTHLACALVRKFCILGRSAFYCRAIDFFTKVKSTFNEPGKTIDDLERKFRRYELLVLDEIEVRSESLWENNLLRSLVDARYASEVATVIITNKNPRQIQEYFSPAILDRVNEGGCMVKCDWPSLRTTEVRT